MRRALIRMHNVPAGVLIEENQHRYIFRYDPTYEGPGISLTLPVVSEPYVFEQFPPFFDGLLPEGIQLDGMLKSHKIDKTDYFTQLLVTGADLVGAVTVTAAEDTDE